MRRLALILLGLTLVIAELALGVTEADARRRHRHRHHQFYMMMPREPPVAFIPRPRLRAPFEERRFRERERAGRFADENIGRAHPGASELVPPDWQLQPPDPKWEGRRYLSPDGSAWLAVYPTPVEQEPLAAHMKTIAFVDGEEITYLRGERDWIAVSGYKGDRIFYRKAVLACGGKRWEHVAFEYPAEAKRSLDPYVAHVARALDVSAHDGCAPNVP